MNSGKVKVRPAAVRESTKVSSKGFLGGKNKGADNIHINETETILKNDLLSFLRSKEQD